MDTKLPAPSSARRNLSVSMVGWMLVLAACAEDEAPSTGMPTRAVRLFDQAELLEVVTPIDVSSRSALLESGAERIHDEPLRRLDPVRHAVHVNLRRAGQDSATPLTGAAAPGGDPGDPHLVLTGPALLLVQIEVGQHPALLVEVQADPGEHGAMRAFATERTDGLTAEQLQSADLAERLLDPGRADLLTLRPKEVDAAGHTWFGATLRPEPSTTHLLVGIWCEKGTAQVHRTRATALSRVAEIVLSSPDAPDRPPCLRSVEIGFERREALVLPAPGHIRLEVDVPPGDPVLSFGAVALDRASPPGYALAVTLTAGEDEVARRYELAPGPRRNAEWVDLELDLAALAGRRAVVTFATRTQPGQPAGAGVAIGSPVIESMPSDPAVLPPDVVLVSLDTVRADRLALYGYPVPTSPALDELARSSVVFDNAIAPASWTLPSHVTVFTGQLPERHRVEAPTSRMMPGMAPLLAPEFRRRGYHTYATTGGGFVRPSFGFAEGFERYGSQDPAYPPKAWAERADQALVEKAERAERERARLLEVLRAPRRRPLFCFAHTYVAHNYQIPPDLLLEMGAAEADVPRLLRGLVLDDLNRWVDAGENTERVRQAAEDAHILYDCGVVLADRFLADVVAALRDGGHLDRTVIVVLSDHGEELFERGNFGHNHSLYEELIRVPLLIHAPGLTPRRVAQVVSLADVAPTLRDLLGLDAPRQVVDGRSLAALCRGGSLEDAPAFGSLLHEQGHYLRCMRGTTLKLIETVWEKRTLHEMYHLERDPGERKNIADRASQELQTLVKALERHSHRFRMRGAVAEDAALSAEMIAELRALGYLGGE